jgi:hypothetical protein
MMLEVFGRGLHGVHHASGVECIAVKPRHADQQALCQRELRDEPGIFAPVVRCGAPLHTLFSERELSADDGVDEVILQDVRMTPEERLIVAVVRACVLSG